MNPSKVHLGELFLKVVVLAMFVWGIFAAQSLWLVQYFIFMGLGFILGDIRIRWVSSTRLRWLHEIIESSDDPHVVHLRIVELIVTTPSFGGMIARCWNWSRRVEDWRCV